MCDSFLFYRSFYEALEDISEQDQLTLIKSVCKYALDGVEPNISGAAAGMFKLIKPQIDANAKRRKDGGKGGRPKTNGYANKKPVVTENKTDGYEGEKPNDNDNDNVNVNVNVNEKEKRTRFTPPAVEEVREYCEERNNGIDPEAFVDFYSSKGWRVGSQPMKDWKACVRTWEKRDRASPKEEKGKFDDIAARLINESMYKGAG